MVKIDRLRGSTQDKSRISKLIKRIKVIKEVKPNQKHIGIKTYKRNLIKSNIISKPIHNIISNSSSESTSKSTPIIQPDVITIPDMENLNTPSNRIDNTKHNYVIAIPSYNRPDIIQNNTLDVLKRHNINPIHITIFVSDKQQYDIYKNAIPSTLYNNIVIGALGLKNQRNFINTYYPEGTHIVEMDDDIKRIVQLDITKRNSKKSIKSGKTKSGKIKSGKTKSGKTKSGKAKSQKTKSGKTKSSKASSRSMSIKPIDDLDEFIKKAFTICTEKNIFLWGVYPLANAYFMTNTITTDLRFIVGPMWGMINRHRQELKLTVDEKENSERTLQHWKLDGAVLRFNNVAIDTNYYKNKGGMQSEGKDRKLEAMKSIAYLHQIYPDITKIYMEKKSGMPEIKLLRTKKKM